MARCLRTVRRMSKGWGAIRNLLNGGLAVIAAASPLRASHDIPELARAIAAVGAEGKGNAEAARAWRGLATQPLASLIPILKAMNGVNDLAANWLRSAAETIVARELQSGARLPIADLEAFVGETTNQPRVRHFALELLSRADAARGEGLLAGMADDPGPDLRRDAIDRKLRQARALLDAGRTNEAKAAFQAVLTKARDAEQVDSIAKNLRKMGETVDVAKAFGFLTEWKVVGPFDSTAGKGFSAVYPPEQSIDLAAEYLGKFGPVRWTNFVSKDDYGNISMNGPYTPLKGAAAYAFTEFHSPNARPVELRLGSKNAFKLWLNGQFLFGQEEYHRNKAIDQYPLPAQLRAGRNTILVKVCQNEQTEDWAVEWDFQLRICDPLGAPLVSSKGGGQ